MQKSTGIEDHFRGGFFCNLRKWLFAILSVGLVPNHIAFIMDGNRRYAKKRNLVERDGHRAGFSSLVFVLRYCFELGVKYVSVYLFSIDNFKRKPGEVDSLMELMQEKIEEMIQQESIINEYGIRLNFIGNFQLLTEPIRDSSEKAKRVTAQNNQRTLTICVAYTSRNEIVHAIQESCEDKWNVIQESKAAKVSNGGIARIDRGLNRNGIDLRNDIKHGSVLEGVEDAVENDVFLHNGNYSGDEITCILQWAG